MYGMICDPGMGSCPPLVALAHAGSKAGIILVPYQPSRKYQQPLVMDFANGYNWNRPIECFFLL